MAIINNSGAWNYLITQFESEADLTQKKIIFQAGNKKAMKEW